MFILGVIAAILSGLSVGILILVFIKERNDKGRYFYLVGAGFTLSNTLLIISSLGAM